MYPKIMGLDVGEKRIGIALSDPLRITAQGLESYQVRGEEADFAYLKALCDKHGIRRLYAASQRIWMEALVRRLKRFWHLRKSFSKLCKGK